MELGVKGKIALVTGASRSIGKSICEVLSREGAFVIGVARTLSELEALSSDRGKARFFPLDLLAPEGVETLLSLLSKENLSPDIVVHNLGGTLNVTSPLCSLSEWRSVMRINVEIPIELNRALIPKMQEKKWGRICHISSIAGLENQGPPSYCAAKAALIAYTRSVGRFFAKDNIVMTSLLPGPILAKGNYWDTASKEKPDHVHRFLEERVALKRLGSPEEISELAAFLCSELSSFCIGSAFLADGGQGKVFFDPSLAGG